MEVFRASSAGRITFVAPDKGAEDCAALRAALLFVPLQVNSGVIRQHSPERDQFSLLWLGRCLTLSYMKTSALTIRLDRALERQLAALAKRLGRSRSDIARDALRRQLAILQFEEARRSIMPFAEARGYLTDEDVFRAVS